MPKTKETLLLEEALRKECRKKREYGCEEVTIGFKADGHGDEIVDFMSMDAEEIFRCYEIKVTLADLKTENRKSFYGQYNYLVVSESLYARHPVWDNYIPPYAGILCGQELKVKRHAKRKEIRKEDMEMLKSSLLRSVFWKYDTNRDAQKIDAVKEWKKQAISWQEAFQQAQQEKEEALWDVKDYECYYRKNHQDASFTVAKGARQMRLEYERRKNGEICWQKIDGKVICPVCGKEALQKDGEAYESVYCPFCGTDLKK